MKISTVILSSCLALGAATCCAQEAAQTTLFANLGEAYYNPDGMTVGDDADALYLNVPNFSRMDENKKKADSAQGGYLLVLKQDGSFERVLEYPVSEKTGQCGPMGLDFGPDGNLYVCDNQYFHNTDRCSRILRVVFENGKPTKRVEVVIENVKLANGIVWRGDKMFYTDSCFDTEDGTNGVIGAGGVFMFDAKEVLPAGRDGAPSIKVVASSDDPHCLAAPKVVKLGRADNTGCDGIAIDKRGVVWFGNFGNGFLYSLWPDKDGNYSRENFAVVFDAIRQKGCDFAAWKNIRLECCDGMFYDAESDRLIINDSQNNAIWAFAPAAPGEKVVPYVVLKTDDNDGANGELDQPCEACRFGDKLIFANFDWPFPGLLNSQVDPPGTLSGIEYAEIQKALIGEK